MYEKTSPFAEKIDQILLRLMESDLTHIQDLLHTAKVQINRSKFAATEKVLLKQVLFMMLALGYALAGLAFAWELARFYVTKKYYF